MREKILRDKEMRRRKAAEELKKDDVSISRLNIVRIECIDIEKFLSL